MNILVISDLHGDFSLAVQACREATPELLLCCGDWGDAEEVTAADLDRFLEICPVLTTFGNHDPLDLLAKMRNRDGHRAAETRARREREGSASSPRSAASGRSRTGCRIT